MRIALNNNTCCYPCTASHGGASGPDVNTLLLLPLDTGFADTSRYNQTPSSGSAVISSGTSKFGAGSMYTNSSSTFYGWGGGAAFPTGTNPFTVDFWINFNALPGGTQQAIFVAWTNSGVGEGLYVSFNANTGVLYSALTLPNVTSATVVVPPTGTWIHYAAVSDGTNFYHFYNGSKGTITGVSSGLGTGGVGDFYFGAPIFGGVPGFSAGNVGLNGFMDEIRISNVARWTSNFTPPTAPY